MKTTKTILCIFLLAALGMILAACSGESTPSSQPSGTAAEESTAALPSSAGVPATQAVSSAEEPATEAVSSAEAPATEPAVEESSQAQPQEDVFPTEGIPVLEVLIDESKGTIAAMNRDPEHNARCYGEIRIDIPAGYRSEYGGTVYGEAVSETYALEYIRGRGNSTWGRDKKPYKIKLDKKADLLGMGEEKNWALLANYYDCTMLRNKLTYMLGEKFLPAGTFVPQSVFVNVKMNGEYLGLYCLSESIRVGKGRVAIEDPSTEEGASEEELSGGYLINMEIQEDEGRVLRTDRNLFQIDTPEYEDLTEPQYEYISGFMQKLENSLCRPEAVTDGTTAADLMDIDSYIDYFLLQEASRNGDGYRSSSTYLYKDRGGKLVFGPLWDFDYVAWGGDLKDPEGFENIDYAPWLIQLLKDDAFRQKLAERWDDLKELLLSAAQDGGWIDQYAAAIRQEVEDNYGAASTFLWEEVLLPGEGGGEEDADESEIKELTPEEAEKRRQTYSFDLEVSRLKDWILKRTAWLDANIREMRSERCRVEFLDGDTMVYYLVLNEGEDLQEDLVPDPEKKAGFRFTGWYRTDEQGQKVPLSTNDPTSLGQDPLVYQAEWEPYDAAADLAGLAFAEEVYYVDSSAYLDIAELVSAAPFDFDKEYLEMAAECEPEGCAYPSDLYLMFVSEGEVRITLSCGDKSASCKLIALDEEKLVLPENYTLPETITMKAGGYGFIPLRPEDGAMAMARRSYEKPEFTVEDPQVAEADANGYLHALAEGETVVTCRDPETGKEWTTVLTVTGQ